MADTELDRTTLDGTDPAAVTARRGSVSVESRAATTTTRQRAVPGRARPSDLPKSSPENHAAAADAEAAQVGARDALVSTDIARGGHASLGLPRERPFRGPAEIVGFAGISVYLLGALLWEGAYSLFRLTLFVVTRGAAKRTLKKVMIRTDHGSSIRASTARKFVALLGLMIALLVISPGCQQMSGRWAAREFERGWEQTTWSLLVITGTPKQHGKELAGLWRDVQKITDPEWGALEESLFLTGIR